MAFPKVTDTTFGRIIANIKETLSKDIGTAMVHGKTKKKAKSIKDTTC